MGKVIIFSAPSGSGKSTIISRLMESGLNLHFSISATSRPPRGKEKNGVEYFFLTPEEFKQRIGKGDFLEHVEVYPGRYYGTLKSQVDAQLSKGENVICDVDVLGSEHIKKVYGDRALSLFIQPPSIEVLKERLDKRGTDTPEVIRDRIDRARFELSFAEKADRVIINDDLETACRETLQVVKTFLKE